MMQKVVLDTAAFIDYFVPDFIHSKYYTTPGVVTEIRDVSARERWNTWKTNITIKSPSASSLKAGFITHFFLLLLSFVHISLQSLHLQEGPAITNFSQKQMKVSQLSPMNLKSKQMGKETSIQFHYPSDMLKYSMKIIYPGNGSHEKLHLSLFELSQMMMGIGKLQEVLRIIGRKALFKSQRMKVVQTKAKKKQKRKMRKNRLFQKENVCFSSFLMFLSIIFAQG